MNERTAQIVRVLEQGGKVTILIPLAPEELEEVVETLQEKGFSVEVTEKETEDGHLVYCVKAEKEVGKH